MSLDWSLFENFSEHEFTCKCGCGKAEMDSAFMQRLQDLRTENGAPIKINSGYRCPTHNESVSSTGANGPHTTGHAADIAIAGADAFELLRLGLTLGFVGVGLDQKGEWSQRYVHLDDLQANNRPRVWTY